MPAGAHSKDGRVRVTVRLPRGGWHGHATEGLWADCVGEAEYRIENTPFFAKDLSFEDVVHATGRRGQLVVDAVVARGGHSTYRLVLEVPRTGRVFRAAWQSLAGLGCSYEQGVGALLAVDVPPTADIHAVYRLLEEGERAGLWDFEEGHCGHPP